MNWLYTCVCYNIITTSMWHYLFTPKLMTSNWLKSCCWFLVKHPDCRPISKRAVSSPFSATMILWMWSISHYIAVSAFPTTYLGLPISNKKLRRCDFLAWIEKIANKLLGWKASLMNLAGRAVLVRFVLTAIPLYLLVALKVAKWFIRATDKIRSFLWKGQMEAAVWLLGRKLWGQLISGD